MIEEVTYDDGRAVLEALGGLSSTGDLAKLWGVTRESVRRFAGERAFPAPAAVIGNRTRLWFTDEVQDWNRAWREEAAA